jgi:Phage tail tube protein
MPVGTNAVFGYAAEGTPGAAAAPSTWIPMKDAEGDLDPSIIFPELMGLGRQVTRYALRGEQKTRGKITNNLFPDMGVDFLHGALGLSGATVPDKSLLQTYTLQLQKGTAGAFQMVGAMINKQVVKAEGGKEVTVETEFFGLDLAPTTAGTETYSDSQPFSFSDGVVTLGGAADDDITHFEFTIDNHLVEQWTIRQSNQTRRTESGKLIVTGKFNKYFADTTLWEQFKALTATTLSIDFTNTGGAVSWTFPRALMKMNKIPVKLGAFIVQEVDWQAAVDPTTNALLTLAAA